ncbi:MAG: DNA alkylation repair protein [Arcobacteraceae bacterium]|nr:DNA alkylation repair protein [Arcobacteraceae bacterium]
MNNQIFNKLKTLSDDNYKAFNNKIIPTKQITLGVRLPILRKIAKEIVKDDAINFLNLDKQNIYEMIMIEGLVLSYMNKPFKELLPSIECFLNKVDNWAQIDSTICSFKNIKKEKNYILDIVKIWIKSDNEFVVRAALIILLSYYIQEENLFMIFKLSQSVKHKGYYVFMGNAWLISVCMAKFPTKTIDFFKDNTLDIKTHNKAIQKSRESYRVSHKDKVIIKLLVK